MANVTLVQELARTGRVTRSPQHSFHLRQRPYQIQPFLIAPVLPGETMKNALLQSRAVTSPIKNPLIGWWAEYYFFYVKHRDLDARDLLVDMMLTPGTDVSSLHSAAVAETYHYAGSIDWASLCLKRVTEEYFRDEGEAWNVATRSNLPLASINQNTWLESVVDETVITEGGDPDDPANNMETLDAYRRQYEFMRSMQMTNMSYEDFIRSYGVRLGAAEEPHKPELIRYVKDWTYPTNTVDPATGNPSSACSWAIAERADKDRFFKEPGFIFGVSVFRPKVYLSRQRGSAVHMMNDAYTWLPAILANDPATSLKEFAAAAGPLATDTTNGYWVDVRDLLIYGDQFINFDLTATDAGLVALPTAGMNKKYVPDASVDALFVSGENALVRQDGICSLTILGTQVDHT